MSERKKNIGPLILNHKETNTKNRIESENEMIDEVLSQYPEGLKNIIETPLPKESEVSCILIMNCPKEYTEAFAKEAAEIQEKAKTQSDYVAPQVMELSQANLTSEALSSIYNPKDEHFSIPALGTDEETLKQRVMQYEERYNEFTVYLNGVFEHFEENFSSIIDGILLKYSQRLIAKQIKFDGNLFSHADKIFKQLYKFQRNYVELTYGDFLFILCSILKYYTGLSISIRLLQAENELMLYFYGDEKCYENIAEFFDYELQLKPFAMQFDTKYSNKFRQQQSRTNAVELTLEEPLLNSTVPNNNSIQYDELKSENASNWPPFVPFKPFKMDKYRLYLNNDEYYNDFSNDDEKEENAQLADGTISKFRNIDKLRLTYRILDYLLKFNYLNQTQLLHIVLFKRNSQAYGKRFMSDKFINDVMHIENTVKSQSAINLLRNYYGESVSFYFLWLNYYCMMLLFPGIIGIIITGWYYFFGRVEALSILNGKIKMSDYDLGLITFCILISLWATIFPSIWKQKENLYTYLWGMENAEKNNPSNENFVPDRQEELVFGQMCPKGRSLWQKCRLYLSYTILLLMMAIVCVFIYIIFQWKARNTTGETYNDLKVSVIVASLNAFQIKAMNLLYYFVAKTLIEWENHEKIDDKNYSLASKLISFDFVNSYSALFYIAFVKPYSEGCVGNNCLKEMEMQLYIVFMINFGLYFVELGLPFFNLQRKMRTMSQINKNQKIEILSLEHQMICDSQDNMMEEYNSLIIQFGYVCLFSVAAPLTPIIVFVLTLIARLVDYYKYVNLIRVDFLEGAKGIGDFNQKMKIMGFIGMMINVAILLFSSPNFVNKDLTAREIETKLLLFAIIENLVLVFIYCWNWNSLPNWFKYIDNIKDLYQKKFYFKNTKGLRANAQEKNKIE